MRILLPIAVLVPTMVFAVGSDDDAPPPTTVTTCSGSQVFDENEGKCVDAKESSLERDALYRTVRQLAYAGRYSDAQIVLDAMATDDPGRLTYLGFIHRKLGDMDLANTYYEQAISADPANILARSYMGQGFVENGDIDLAMVQLQKIRAFGGSGTWAEKSLRNAIATGKTFNY